MVNLLERVAIGEIDTEKEAEGLPRKRKRLIQTIGQWARDAQFTEKVLNAYGRRCAVTRAQLRLLDAAHIYPVKAPGSTDEVTNGIAISPTYHRAFDHGLIFLDTDLKMKINERRVEVLTSQKLIDGLSDFSHFLGRKIYLPLDPHQRPSAEMIRRANHFRGIAG
jgi:putative restriction endonuclease